MTTNRQLSAAALNPTWSESDLRSLLENLPLPAYLCDSSGLITYFSPRAKLLWGREPKLNDASDRFCGSLRLFLPDGTPIKHDQSWIALVLAKAQPVDGYELIIERPDASRANVVGSANPFHHERGNLLGAVNVLFDITDPELGENAANREICRLLSQWTAAEIERKQAERRYQELVDSVEIIVWRGDARTLHFTFVSKQAETILGYPADRWLAEPTFWREHVHPEDREWAYASCKKAIQEKRNHQMEYRMIAADGRTVWFHDVINVVQENGEPKELTGIMVDISERKKTEEEREKLHQQVLANREQLQILTRRLIQAQEEERRQLAGELHDEVGQILTAVSLSLEFMRGTVDGEVRGNLEESTAAVNRAIDQVRNMSLNLRPAMLDLMGLESALRWFVDRQVNSTGIKMAIVSSLEGKRLGPELETACFRIVQEALTNVARHARTHSVRIELGQNGGDLFLSIQDDGTGFDAAAARRRATTGGSFGLLGMEERVRLLGGSFEIDSAIGRGTTVRVRFPLA